MFNNATLCGSVVTSDVFIKYFKDNWGSPIAPSMPIRLLIPKLIDEEAGHTHCKDFTMEELEKIVESFPDDKAPGPDGFSAIFFKSYWDTIKKDLFDVVCYFAKTGSLPVQWKSNFIALVPKVPNPQTPDKFGPISLCYVVCKIVSKLLPNRLKPLLEKGYPLNAGSPSIPWSHHALLQGPCW